MEILITICARGGSKGILGKNIKMINGKPLIYFTLKTASLFKDKLDYPIDIVISTDSNEIKSVVSSFDFEVDLNYIRPEFLSTDSAGKVGAIKDVKSYMEKKHKKKYDYILDLDVTSPLRSVKDLENALELIHDNKDAYNLFSVSPANRNPYFNMVEKNKDGYYDLCKDNVSLTRQSAPQVLELNASFYWYKKIYFENDFNSAITNKSLVYIMDHICFDLDHPIDFDFMEYLLKNNKLDFNFI
jgi:CMP-N,N'-diacetyllegionaminic acid synthase